MKKNLQSNKNKVTISAISFLAILAIAFVIKTQFLDNGFTKDTTVTENTDIVIPVSGISETATFYPAEINGTKLEVIAVTAPDGTNRTAFNTCQICYSSGRGYYVQEGDVLVCQNCGNRFEMDEVEVTRGGCNPVPITSEYKTIDSENITISNEYLMEATAIFQKWKS